MTRGRIIGVLIALGLLILLVSALHSCRSGSHPHTPETVQDTTLVP
jgi:hypothetical protein